MGTGRPGVRAAAIDWGIAGCMAAALLVTGLSERHSAAGPDLLGYALLVAGGLALALRRRAPVPVLVVTG
ncbi:sensor histidine kinase, partial [Actinomadura welshii]